MNGKKRNVIVISSQDVYWSIEEMYENYRLVGEPFFVYLSYKDYILPQEIDYPKELHDIKKIEEYFINEREATFFQPIYVYDHSTISFTESRTCTWDSSLAGFMVSFVPHSETSQLDMFKMYREELNNLTDIVNGWMYSVSLRVDTDCDCCNATSSEYIETIYEGFNHDFNIDEITKYVQEYLDGEKYEIEDQEGFIY